MKGAICGDVIGSRFEGVHRNTKKKDFKLIAEINGRGQGSKITDDSYLTVAVADAIMSLNEVDIKDDQIVIERVKDYFIKYRDINSHIIRYCGHQFKEWLYSNEHKPYNGWTNGAVMRCSSAGFIAKSAEDAYRLGGLTAMPTHSSEEAVKAASVLAKMIYLLRNKATKDEVKAYFSENYEIPSLDWAEQNSKIFLDTDNEYHCNLSSEYTLKAAFISFYESNDFESAIRTAVLLGGDSDTIAAVVGPLAECYYGIPNEIWSKVETRLPDYLLEVVNRLYDRI